MSPGPYAASDDEHIQWLGSAPDDERDFDDLQDDALCWECGQIYELCECHIGEECGRWRNGVLDDSCSKAGSEECDFECPYNR